MKKIFYLASIAALAFSSCAKDDTTQAELGTVTGGSKITAAMGNDTRTYLDENKQFRWEGTDAIAVYNDNAAAPMNGTQFKMTEGDKSTVAVFNGPALNAKYNHLAVYPWTQQKAFTDVVWAKNVQIPGKANGTKGNILSYTASGDADVSATNWVGKVDQIVANIPATQEYYPGTFGNGVVPAISTTFTIGEDGSADVSMQPVADYLFVDIMSVEPIKDLTLVIYNNDQQLTIAGSNALTSYLYDGKIRYYMGAPATGANEIKLVTNERAPEVSCHEANTYVFVVPAGILGANKLESGYGVEAFVTVNKGTTNEWTFAAVKNTQKQPKQDRITNAHLNYKLKDATKADTANNRVIRATDTQTAYANKTIPAFNRPMENTVFYMNQKKANGEVIPFVYNPENTYIIEHEGHLLQYLTEYGTADFGYVDAIICAQHTFDFSEEHITALSDQKHPLYEEVYAEFEEYFAAYLGKGGSFPVITAQKGYINSFNGVEFNGNVPTITGIYQPLRGANGIFGNITVDGEAKGSVSNVSFDGIVAGSALSGTLSDYYQAYVYTDGLILGSINGGSISNVTVKNAEGLAILDKANNAAYNALTVEDAEGLSFIALDMDLTADLEIKNWANVSAVAYSVFGTLDAALNDGDYHHVVKLPATAEYADLAAYVSTANTTGTFASAIGNLTIAEHAVLDMAAVKPIPAAQKDQSVVSVLVGETSIWTGDTFNLGDEAYKTAGGKVAPAQYKASDANYPSYFKIEYAEQAASGGAPINSGVVERNMDMSYAVNPWKMVTFKHIEGNNKVVKGIHMDEAGVEAFDGDVYNQAQTDYSNEYKAWAEDFAETAIAPLDVYKVTNLTVDGVTIDIYTANGEVVPGNIAGLAWRAQDIQNVTVKNLVITGDGANRNNEEYADLEPVFIGWLVANTVNPWITNSKVEGVNSSIGGIAGLVGKIDMTTDASSHPGVRVENSAATNVESGLTAIAADVEAKNVSWGKVNVAGTTVGYIKNSKGADVTVTLKGNGEPSFIYYSPKRLNVSYNGSTVAKTLKNYGGLSYLTK